MKPKHIISLFLLILLLAGIHNQLNPQSLPLEGLLPGLVDTSATRHMIVLGLVVVGILLAKKHIFQKERRSNEDRKS